MSFFSVTGDSMNGSFVIVTVDVVHWIFESWFLILILTLICDFVVKQTVHDFVFFARDFAPGLFWGHCHCAVEVFDSGYFAGCIV